MADEKKPIDWAEIERDYRAGSMSIREIARWYSLSEGAIRKRAKAKGWTRASTQESTQAKGAHDPEPKRIYEGTVLTPENTSPEAIVGRGRNLVMRLLDELDATTCRIGELDDIISMATDTADAGKQREALQQAIGLKNRSEVLKALATATKTFAESGAPQGVKKQRQEAGERAAKGGGRFASPPPPGTLRLVQ